MPARLWFVSLRWATQLSSQHSLIHLVEEFRFMDMIWKEKREEEIILVAISVVLKFWYLQLFFFFCTSIFVWYVLSDRMDFIWFFKHPIAQTSGKLQYLAELLFLFCNFSHDWLLNLRYYLRKQLKLIISQKMILTKKDKKKKKKKHYKWLYKRIFNECFVILEYIICKMRSMFE